MSWAATPQGEESEAAGALQLLEGYLSILPITVDGENYYTEKVAAEYLGIARDTFYRNVRNRLPTYHYGAFRREYFRQTDLDRYKGIRPAEEDEQSRD